MLSVIMSNADIVCVNIRSIIILCLVMLRFDMLSAVMLFVVLQSVAAPNKLVHKIH
jgi:hypothetical protein